MDSTLTTRRWGVSLLAAIVTAAVLVPAVAARAAAPNDLLITEYVEGTSNNKALELTNLTGGSLGMANYELVGYHNGSTSPTYEIPLTGTLDDGESFVFAHASAAAEILAVADQTDGRGLWNGNDALVIRSGTTVVDSFGQVGNDAVFAQDQTYRREAAACTGDTNPDDAFDPTADYAAQGTNVFAGLGSHTVDCDGGGGGGSDVVINEFVADHSGADITEYVEVYGPADTDLSDLTLLEFEGDSNKGVVDEVAAVGTTDADGFWLLDLPGGALENGTITLLLVRDFTGALSDDLDTDDDGTLDVTPWSEVVDGVAVDDGGAGDLTYTAATLGPNYDGLDGSPPGGASRIPDGTDTDTAADWVRNDYDLAGIAGETGTPEFGEAYNTPGASNVAVEEPAGGVCGDPTVTIGSVQGSGDASPVVGETVEVEGTVVGDFQTGGFNGYYVQDAGDGDPATSDGIFVFDSGSDVSSGDVVHVTGTVSEFGGLTELTPDAVDVCATGTDLPAPTEVLLPETLADLDDFTGFERYEGMYVTLPQDLVILEYFNYDRFGEIVLGTERQFQPTAVYEPGSAEAQALEIYNDTARITLDDGLSAQNPQVTRHPNGDPFTLDNRFRGGDLVTNTTGVLDDRFSLYRIQPTEGADFAVANPRPDVPDVGGRLQVAAFNVLNYFPTLDYPTGDPRDNACGPAQDQECRGADTELEFERQEAKIVAALAAMDADIVGLMEIENSPTAVETLVAALNDEVGAGTYAAISTGYLGTDAIKVGLIYKTDSVDPKGEYAVLDQSVDPRFLDSKNRPVLAQTFVEHGTGADVLVAVNHLKSKGSSCSDVGDPDLPDTEGGNCDGVRTAAAEALVDWLDTDPTNVHPGNILITGDLNSYDKEDPIDAIVAGGYTDLLYDYQGEYAYSYVFDGQLGYLDHALANADLAADVTGAAVWHAHTDEPDLIDYDTSFKSDGQDAIYAPDEFRASDHDAVLVGMDLDRPGKRNCQDKGQGNGNGCRP